MGCLYRRATGSGFDTPADDSAADGGAGHDGPGAGGRIEASAGCRMPSSPLSGRGGRCRQGPTVAMPADEACRGNRIPQPTAATAACVGTGRAATAGRRKRTGAQRPQPSRWPRWARRAIGSGRGEFLRARARRVGWGGSAMPSPGRGRDEHATWPPPDAAPTDPSRPRRGAAVSTPAARSGRCSRWGSAAGSPGAPARPPRSRPPARPRSPPCPATARKR